MTFQQWWNAYWKKPETVPEIFNLAFKEVAEAAWNASNSDA